MSSVRPKIAGAIGVLVLGDALFGIHVPARLPHGAAFRGDQHDPVGRLNAVERGRRRALHDLDVRDIVGIDVVDPGSGLATDIVGVVLRGRVDANPIHVVERLIGERDAVGSPDPDLGAGAHHAAALEYLHSGRATLYEVTELGDRRLLGHLRGVDGRDSVADLQLALLPGCRGDNLLQLHRHRCHREVEGIGLCRPDRHRLDLGAESDGHRADLIFPGLEAPEQVAAILPGALDPRGAGQQDSGAGDPLAGALVGHPSGELTFLRHQRCRYEIASQNDAKAKQTSQMHMNLGAERPTVTRLETGVRQAQAYRCADCKREEGNRAP